ncbi:MAG: hypothetical protein L3J13_09225 [Devosiaceae bacterium]|nr:hypothetical protein [Devosiaceae bacterium]
MQAAMPVSDPSGKGKVSSEHPLGRALETTQVAQLVLYVFSDLSDLLKMALNNLEQGGAGALSRWE